MSKFEIIIEIHKDGESRAVSTTILHADALDPVLLAKIMREMAQTLHHDLVGQGWIYPRTDAGQIIRPPADWFQPDQVLEVGEM